MKILTLRRAAPFVSFLLLLGFVAGCADLPTDPDPASDVISLGDQELLGEVLAGKKGGRPIASATGSGHFRYDGGGRAFTVSAHQYTDGSASGRLNLNWSGSISIGADITCMSRKGNDVWIGAAITKAPDWLTAPDLVMKLRDNGQGQVDEISWVVTSPGSFLPHEPAIFCDLDNPLGGLVSDPNLGWVPPLMFPIDAGNLQIGAPGLHVAYEENFERGVGPEWSLIEPTPSFAGDEPMFLGDPSDPRSTSPTGKTFLGDFSEEQVHGAKLTLNNLPPHSEIRLAFDVYVIRSMDGNTETITHEGETFTIGPDFFMYSEASAGQLFETTFSGFCGPQSFPDPYFTDNEGCSSAFEVNDLGYTFDGSPTDVINPVVLTIPHSGSTAEITFTARNLQDYLDQSGSFFADESWGIDNVRVETIR